MAKKPVRNPKLPKGKSTPQKPINNVDPKSGYEYVESPESSSIMRSEYDRVNSILYVQFKHGKTYSHEKFPPEGWDAFRKAPSKGKHYNEFIRDSYTSAVV